MQEDDGGRTVKVEVSLLVLRLPPGVPLPAPASAAAAARNTLAVVDPAATSSGGSYNFYRFIFVFIPRQCSFCVIFFCKCLSRTIKAMCQLAHHLDFVCLYASCACQSVLAHKTRPD